MNKQDFALELAQKVRTDLDKLSCPDFWMRVAFESIIKYHDEINERQARDVLGDIIKKDNSLYASYANSNAMKWNIDSDKATFDGDFNAEELEAIAWWMRNKGDKQ